MKKENNTLILLGKIPPPYYGTSVSMQIFLNSNFLASQLNVVSLNTNVHKDLSTLGKFSVKKIFLNIAIYLRFIKILNSNKKAVVLIPISQTSLGFFKDAIFIILSFAFGQKVLLHLHGSALLNWYNVQRAIIQKIIYAIISRCKGGIVLGENLKYLFQPFLPTDKIWVMPNGANYNLNEQLILKNINSIQALYIGNLQASKGIDDVIQALQELKLKHHLNVNLNIVGAWRDENTKRKILGKINENQLNVTIHGIKTGLEKFEILQKCNLMLFTPRAPEGHPWVIVEALACGLAVISTNQGAIAESVLHEVNGYIVGAKSPAEIAEKVKLLASNKILLKNMQEASRKHYLSNFTEQKMIEKLVFCVNKVVQNEY